jgi:uncharacterized protein YndB with AHSA1/START domain
MIMAVQKTFEQTKVLDAPHAHVWEIIARASGINDWLPAITTCRLEGEGENAKRFCETADGKYLKETIDRVDHENFIFEYTIYEQNMMPLSNYKGKYEVKDLGNGKTEITWSSVFDTEEDHFPAIEEGLEGLYQMGFDGLEKLAKAEAV